MPGNPGVIYIAAAGHSGSTLLDLLLGGHGKITSAGELHRLSLYARNGEDCTCGAPVDRCPFWTRVAQVAGHALDHPDGLTLMRDMEVMLQVDEIGALRGGLQKALAVSGVCPPRWLSSRVIGKTHCRSIDNSLFWMRCICKADETGMVVDSTKDVRRLKMYFFRAPESLRVLHLVRDGRAVSASAMRRLGCTMTAAASDWNRKNTRIQAAMRGIPVNHVLLVRYEDLCRDPEDVLTRICTFLGVDYDASMIKLRKQQRHNIGGNPMRFRREEVDIRPDARWKSQLAEADILEFERVAGRLNAALGYTDDWRS